LIQGHKGYQSLGGRGSHPHFFVICFLFSDIINLVMQDLDTLIEIVIKEGASDLHISEDRIPYVRVASQLVPLSNYPKFTREMMEDILKNTLSALKRSAFDATQSCDFAYGHKDERFRAHVFIEQHKICMTLRHIPKNVPTISELDLPESLNNFARLKSGFFLVVGPTGHGKSTTLASLVNTINEERLENIITIEDPIEYTFTSKKSIIFQREVGTDTPSFSLALRDSFRDDINVLMVGEMRDAETMSAAVSAAPKPPSTIRRSPISVWHSTCTRT